MDPHTLHINPLLFGCPDCTARLCMHCIQPSAIAGTLSGLQYLWPEQEGSNWATPQQPLGQFLYDTYTEEDYHIIWETYSYSDFSWDFGKLNSSVAKPRHSRLSPAITKVYKQQVTQILTPWVLACRWHMILVTTAATKLQNDTRTGFWCCGVVSPKSLSGMLAIKWRTCNTPGMCCRPYTNA